MNINPNEILNEITDTLQLEESLTLTTNLNLLRDWDSLGKMSIMALFKTKFNTAVTLEQLSKVSTPQDLINLINNK